MHRLPLAVFVLMLLALASVSPAQADEYEFEWPGFQGGLQPGPSNTEIKAKKPRIKPIPPAEGTRSDRAKFSGYWEGWMCRKRSVDVNVFVHEVTDKDANMRYSAANEHSLRGGFVRRRTAEFRGDVLILKMRGADIILGMRPDGHMNIKWDADKSGRGWCTGVMQRTLSPPVRNEAEKDEPSNRSSRSASDGTRGR